MEQDRMDKDLLQAARDGQLGELKPLILKGANVNFSDLVNPIGAAAQKGRIMCLEALIEAKADVNQRTYNDITALHRASMEGKTEAMIILLKNGAKVNCWTSGHKPRTPLDMAVEQDNIDCVILLVQHGAYTTDILCFAFDLSLQLNRSRCIRYFFHIIPRKRYYCQRHLYDRLEPLIKERRNTQSVTKKWMGILRKRVKVEDPSTQHIQGRLPRDVVTLLGHYVWATRLYEKWKMK
jgi:ankyrin repeat protein